MSETSGTFISNICEYKLVYMLESEIFRNQKFVYLTHL